jgi:MFS family permease
MTTSATDPARQTDWAIVYAATFAGITIALQTGKAAATLPLIRAEFGVDLTLLATYVSLISVVAATIGIVFGTITRRMGARRAGLTGLALVAIGSVAGAGADGVTVLLTSRVIEAFGFALTVTAMPAVIQPATQPRDRMLALGIWATWLPAGVALMMLIAFFFLDDIGWRGVFRVAAILPALAAVILYGATKTQLSVQVVSAAATLRGMFRRDVVLTTLVFVAFSSSNLIVLAFLPTMLVDTFGMAANQAAIISFAGAIALISTNILAGWLLHKGAGLRLLYAAGFAGMIVFAAILLGPEFRQTSRVGAGIMFSFAAGIPPALVWASIPILARDQTEVPVLSGLFFQGAGIGQIIGPMLAAWAVSGGDDWRAAFWAIAGLAGAGLILAMGLNMRHNPQ